MKNYREILLKFIVLRNCSKHIALKNCINIIDQYICIYSQEYHEKSTLKDYCVSRIEPALSVEFNRGDIISIKLRTDIEDIAKQFKLKFLENDYLRTIFIDEVVIYPKNIISSIYTLTPTIFTSQLENKYILSNRNNLKGLKEIILKNAKAKCQLKEEYDFIENITIKNIFPISIKIPRETGDATYLGDKFEIQVKNDEMSQRIAQTFIVKGMGKYCTSGSGFINFKK